MTTIRAFIKHHPVGSYFGLAFTIAWAGSFLAVGPKFIRGETMQFSDELLIAMTAMRVLIVWVYVNTRSLLLAQLMHASSTGFLAVLDPTSISPAYSTLWYAIYGVVLWIVVAVVAIYGEDLTHRQLQVQLA